METYKTKQTKCPHCGYKFDAASTIIGEEGAPSKGDLSVCLKCQNWLVYKNNYEVRPITEKEIAKLPEDVFQTLTRASKAAHIATNGGKEIK